MVIACIAVSRSFRVTKMILLVAIPLGITITKNSLLVIRGYNLAVYYGGGMLVANLYVIYCNW
jgi:hypothetical protein